MKNFIITFNVPLLIISNIYALVETWYFGWNRTPQTTAEVIGDIIGGIIFLSAIRVRRRKYT
jgi:hypothetical protein